MASSAGLASRTTSYCRDGPTKLRGWMASTAGLVSRTKSCSRIGPRKPPGWIASTAGLVSRTKNCSRIGPRKLPGLDDIDCWSRVAHKKAAVGLGLGKPGAGLHRLLASCSEQ
ncbi:hypothetical protein MRX96_016027 [Rhipicephalus microplus]